MTYSIVKRTALTFSAVAIALATPVAAFALGFAPANRPTYTWTGPKTVGANHVVFNSFTNAPNYGDERAFFDGKDNAIKTAGGFKDVIQVNPGQEVLLRMYIHNNADATLNAGGTGIAKNTRVRIQLPTATGTSLGAVSYISADNANNQVKDTNGAVNVVSDSVNFQDSNVPFSVSYIPGSAMVYNNAHINGLALSDDIMGADGTKIGYDTMDGLVPGCFPHVSQVTVKVKINGPVLTVNKQVTIPGSADWQKSLTATPGDTISWLLTINNPSKTTDLKSIAVRDQLPAHLKLVPGSVTYFDSKFPAGKVLSDTALFNEGVQTPDFAPQTSVTIRYRTTVNADFAAADCNPALKNLVQVSAFGVNPVYSDASVNVNHACTTPTPTPTPTPSPLPETGPVGALGGALGITGLGYAASAYVRSRQSLKDVLRKK
jgi:uncharacterized repeat protein (TIGR01451 family)